MKIPVYKSEVYFCNLKDIKKLFMTRVVSTLNVTKTSIYPLNLERELLYVDRSIYRRYGFKGTVSIITSDSQCKEGKARYHGTL